ncbi:MAG: hypothetical protein E6Q68_08595 [Polynucleobacter sp.]|nr:MAG: hypothetical protein E6Q68_08595 [Polynucleobacter sp.]
MIGIFVAALADGRGYRVVHRHGTSEQVVSVVAGPGPVRLRKKPTTSRNVGCGALDEPCSKNKQHTSHRRPDLSFFHGESPWKNLPRRFRYFANTYHAGSARSVKPNRLPAKHRTI